MNDNIIISTISKIHFVIISALSFIFLILFTVFVFLQNGIYLEDTSFQNVKIKKLYIKWDEKISLIAKEIEISEKKKETDSQDDYEENIKTIKERLPYLNWFKEITLERIAYNDIEATLHYIENESGFMNVSSSDFSINAKLLSENGLLHLNIEDFLLTNKNTKIHGDAVFSLNNGLELTAALSIDIGDETKLKLYASGNRDKLLYKIESDKDIKDTREIVDLFNVDPRAKYWMYDAITASGLSLNRLYGWIDYKNIDEAYLNLHVKATAHDLTYVYDKKVDSVRTKKTELEFKDGVLYIIPKDAYSYGFFLDKSWLKIDFTKKEELLTLYLLFKGQANKELLYLLDRYGIKLPFIQTKGEMDTNLKLDINLISADVEAIGDFYAKEAQINYLGLDIDIFDARIAINNSNVKVKNMGAKYGDIASAHVDLDFRAKESKGELAFRFESINSTDNSLMLLKDKTPLVALYTISNEQDYLEIEKSHWSYKGENLHVDAMKIPFNIESISAKIPPTKIKSDKTLSAILFGDLLFKEKKADIGIKISSLNLMGIELDKTKPLLNLLYDKERLVISSRNLVKLKTDTSKFTLNNVAAEIRQDILKVNNLTLKYEESLSAKINSEYSLKESVGFVKIHDLKYIDASLGEIFKNEDDIELLLQSKENKVFISSKNHDFEYTFWDEAWKLSVNSIDKIALHSKILTDYNLTNGSFEISKAKDEKNAKFSLKTDYQYKFLATEASPMESYFVNGEVDTKTKDIFLKINEAVDVEIKDDIKIKAENIGINLHEITTFFSDRNSSSDENSTLKVSVDTKNCFIFVSENRHVISDTINFRLVNKVLSGELSHKQGRAVFNLKDDAFHLYGDNFNDEFMGRLFYLSKFKGGALEFYINGPIDEYEGMIYIKDTTILDYKILNNILAFVNTVPSLVTFSLPGYNKNGIAAKNAYVNFKFKDDVYNISDIYLKSKEIEIVGFGEASTEKNSIDLDLNLRTSLGSSFSKIPLLGHILMGKENVSTTLKVTGKLDDPDIDTQIAKDIAVAPFNIIKRTFMLPFELFKDKESE
jgi:hypothetical protein